MLHRDIRKAKEALEKEVDKGNLHAKSVFKLSLKVDALVVRHYNESLDKENKIRLEVAAATRLINQFLEQKNLDLRRLKFRINIPARNELIVKLREEGFSIRKIATYLGIKVKITYVGFKSKQIKV
jgi:hypothetical protein